MATLALGPEAWDRGLRTAPGCAAAGRAVDYLEGNGGSAGGLLSSWHGHDRGHRRGRSKASRELLAHLAVCLDLPLRERNRLLLAAGYAPEHPERPYDHPDPEALRQALGLMLAGLEPNPALVVDRTWNLLAANEAAGLLTDGVDPGLLEPPVNVLRLAFHPGGLPTISTPSPACNLAFFERLRRKSLDAADEELARLLDELEGYLPDPESTASPGRGGPLLGSFELATALGGVRLFSVITTLGAPIEVTSADLAIETFLPADTASAALLRRLAEHRRRAPR